MFIVKRTLLLISLAFCSAPCWALPNSFVPTWGLCEEIFPEEPVPSTGARFGRELDYKRMQKFLKVVRDQSDLIEYLNRLVIEKSPLLSDPNHAAALAEYFVLRAHPKNQTLVLPGIDLRVHRWGVMATQYDN